MYQLLVIFSLAACAFAMPIDENTVEAKFEERPEFNVTEFNVTVVPTRMSHVIKNFLNLKIGRCSYKEYAMETTYCERKFFLSFREDHMESESCSMKLEEMKECIIEGLEFCLDEKMPKSVLESTIEHVREGMKPYHKFYCSDKGYPVSEMLKSFNASEMGCSAGFNTQVDECLSPLMEMYRKNRGNASLCGEYNKAVKCFNETFTTYCEFNFGNNSWMFSKKFNPFCDNKQRNETMEEWEKEDHEDHDHDDDYHDHDHDHDHDYKDGDYDHDHEHEHDDKDDDYYGYKDGDHDHDHDGDYDYDDKYENHGYMRGYKKKDYYRFKG